MTALVPGRIFNTTLGEAQSHHTTDTTSPPTSRPSHTTPLPLPRADLFCGMSVVDLDVVNFDDPVEISRSRVDAEVDIDSLSSAGDRAGTGDGESAEAQNQGTQSTEDENLHGQIDDFSTTSWHMQDEAECNDVVNDCTCKSLAFDMRFKTNQWTDYVKSLNAVARDLFIDFLGISFMHLLLIV